MSWHFGRPIDRLKQPNVEDETVHTRVEGSPAPSTGPAITLPCRDIVDGVYGGNAMPSTFILLVP